MHLSPPHLTIALYADVPEEDSFAGLCAAALSKGCVSDGVVEMAPWDAGFELSSLVGRTWPRSGTDPSRQYAEGRIVEAVLSVKRYGPVVATYQYAPPGERHPVHLTMSARALGWPDELLSKQDRHAAAAMAAWTRSLLEEACRRCDPAYAGIGVEFWLPTPSQLAGDQLPSEVYVSRRLLPADLAACFEGGQIVQWEHGVFHSGCAPFIRRTLPDLQARLRRASRSLAKALGRR
ncbi:hypothetical protein [Nonomuraea typhae]|uniref:Uncharacterized protein n=1 Tax=Nonomuraea typhae TaxID=2603600 RepID=A0ABW7Z6K7_9ACTN